MRTLILLALSLFPWIVLPAQTLTGRWIGVHIQQDVDQFCPLPIYMDFLPDSTWRLGSLDGADEPKLGKWALLRGDTLLMNGVRYRPGLVRLQSDTLRVGRASPMTFWRFKPVPIDANKLWQRLAGHIWQSDSTELWIQADGRVGVLNRRTDAQTVRHAEVLNLDGSAFWRLRGNAFGPNSQVHDSRQVIRADAKIIQLAGLNGRNTELETFRWKRALTLRDTLQQTSFVSCAGCLSKGAWISGHDNNDQARLLKALFIKQFVPVEAPEQSGLVLVSFTINCRGDRSPVVLKQYDADYHARPFDRRITDQILTLCQVRVENAWFGFSEKEVSEADIEARFTLRLLDGRIIEVY